MPANLSDWLLQIEQVCRKNQPNQQTFGDILKAYQCANLTINSKVVTIAGTNGKGTAIALMQAYYHALGYRVLSYTSPHLMRFEERICFANQPLSSQTWCRLLSQVQQLVNQYQVDLSYFEWITMASFFAIEQFQPDIALMEIGLGGRKDAVNVLPAQLSIITQIDLDHTEILGHTRNAIAFEKAGVMRSGHLCIVGDDDPPEAIFQCAKQQQAKLLCSGIDFFVDQHKVTYQDQVVQGIPMQLAAASMGCALVAIDQLSDLAPLDLSQLQDIVNQLTVPGRLELIKQGQKSYLFDVSHNLASCQRLADFINQIDGQGTKLIIFNCKSNKDISGCLAPLANDCDHFIYLAMDNRGMATFEQVKQQMHHLNPKCKVDCLAVHQLQEVCRVVDFIVVYGSFLTVAVVKHQMNLM